MHFLERDKHPQILRPPRGQRAYSKWDFDVSFSLGKLTARQSVYYKYVARTFLMWMIFLDLRILSSAHSAMHTPLPTYLDRISCLRTIKLVAGEEAQILCAHATLHCRFCINRYAGSKMIEIPRVVRASVIDEY
jgi:hypothetical protein